jgi:hypothetical protein
MKYKTKRDRESGLLRIISIKDGEIGGLIESQRNLSQYGSCWIDSSSKVTGRAIIYEDAAILDGS